MSGFKYEQRRCTCYLLLTESSLLQADVDLVPQILLNVTAGQLLELQQNLGRVWHRFHWASPAIIADHMRTYVPDRDRAESIIQDDAFSTLMQWLYSRMT